MLRFSALDKNRMALCNIIDFSSLEQQQKMKEKQNKHHNNMQRKFDGRGLAFSRFLNRRFWYALWLKRAPGFHIKLFSHIYCRQNGARLTNSTWMSEKFERHWNWLHPIDIFGKQSIKCFFLKSNQIQKRPKKGPVNTMWTVSIWSIRLSTQLFVHKLWYETFAW